LRKAPVYAAAGIPEYWIVNLRDDVVEIFRAPERAAARYTETRIARRGERLELVALLGASVAVDDLLPEAWAGRGAPMTERHPTDLGATVAGIRFPFCALNAAGAWSSTPSQLRAPARSATGAIVLKTATWHPFVHPAYRSLHNP